MTKPVESSSEPQQRSTTFDLIPPDDMRQPILNSIRRYRAACRQLFAVVGLAQAAGASLVEKDDGSVSLKPSGIQAKIIATAAMTDAEVTSEALGKGNGSRLSIPVGSGANYELRRWFLEDLMPGAMSFVWDSARRDINTAWTARDAEFPQASRGWLALQGARGLAQFQRRGIGFPLATAHPLLEGRTLTLRWHHDLGTLVFNTPRMDGGRYHVWRALRDGDEGWKLGTLYLNERDGKLLATVTHERPANLASVDQERVCRVTFGERVDGGNQNVERVDARIGIGDPENYLRIIGPDGMSSYDTISMVEAVAWLARQRVRREQLERRRAACGNPRRPWGHRKGWLAAQDVLSRATLLRERGQAQRNHAWSRRLVTRAVAWRCGVISVEGMPADLLGHPWGWAQFREDVKYKAAERGITAVFGEAGGNGEG